VVETPSAKSKAEVDPNFEEQIRRIRDRAKEEGEARENNEQTQWLMPNKQPGGVDIEWSGDLFDCEDLSTPFLRDGANDKFEEATKDAEDSGVTGDLIITTLQVDYLACMERAFRCRHTMRRPRAMAHMTGRRKGHGDEKGTLTQVNLEYIRNLLKRAQAGGG
jgi:hypothetical protein